jgi:muconolactone delta-isomerase
VPAAGVPLRTYVEVLNVTPLGNVPDSLIVGVGDPVAVAAKVPADPTVNVVLVALVKIGDWLAVTTVSVKLWTAFVPTSLLAVNVIGYVPAVPDAGMPLRTPALKVTPLGKFPDSLIAGTGNPAAITLNVPDEPVVNVVLVALVIAGA